MAKNNNLLVSIAMTVCNGERFLREQLESLAKQTQLPDELIVFDDQSTDRSMEIVLQFSRESDFTVKIFKNSKRDGFIQNFSNAIKECSGDIIFLCDQDDYWLPQKIELIVTQFLGSAPPLLVTHDAELTDSSLCRSGITISGQLAAAGFPATHLHHGCCMAFRREIKSFILPIPDGESGHDTWTHRFALALKSTMYVDEVLVLYRRHNSTTSNFYLNEAMPVTTLVRFKSKISTILIRVHPGEACTKRLKLVNNILTRLKENEDLLRSLNLEKRAVELKRNLECEKDFNEKRYELFSLPAYKALIRVAALYAEGQYKYSNGILSLLKDSCFILFANQTKNERLARR
jgi:glycosyltransferase involved in cell wall biosynthesis